jgi:hypothetical protein
MFEFASACAHRATLQSETPDGYHAPHVEKYQYGRIIQVKIDKRNAAVCFL